MSKLRPNEKPTRSQVASWESIGREAYRRQRDMPTGRGREETTKRRGWLLAASEAHPGGWVKDIPPPPETCD